MFIRTEGILLRSTPYQEYDIILELLTAENGRMNLIRKAPKRRQERSAPLPLFCVVEAVYTPGKAGAAGPGLARCSELTPLRWHMGLRQQFSRIAAAAAFVKAIRAALLPGVSAPKIYALLLSYLAALAAGSPPNALVASFQLKLLRHEGLWRDIGTKCCRCGALIVAVCAVRGCETFCPCHAPSHAIPFTQQDAFLLNALAAIQSFSALANCDLSADCAAKAESLFVHALT